jgi:hypothetical protein
MLPLGDVAYLQDIFLNDAKASDVFLFKKLSKVAASFRKGVLRYLFKEEDVL